VVPSLLLVYSRLVNGSHLALLIALFMPVGMKQGMLNILLKEGEIYMENLSVIKTAIKRVDFKLADKIEEIGPTKESTEAIGFLKDLRDAVMIFDSWCELYVALVTEEGPNTILNEVHCEIGCLIAEMG
jgi:hypothetical protein